jgi:hypothetical protein
MAQDGPKRMFLLTTPRTASNLLTKILNLDEQPNILSHSNRELFFAPTMKWRLGPAQLGAKPISEWTDEQKEGLKGTFQACADGLVKVLRDAEEKGKDVYLKEHVNFMLDPVGESRWAYNDEYASELPWTVSVDGLSNESHSEGNVTVLGDEFMKSWL